MHKAENSEACHPYTHLNSLEGNIPSSWVHLLWLFLPIQRLWNLHRKQILPELLHGEL